MTGFVSTLLHCSSTSFPLHRELLPVAIGNAVCSASVLHTSSSSSRYSVANVYRSRADRQAWRMARWSAWLEWDVQGEFAGDHWTDWRAGPWTEWTEAKHKRSVSFKLPLPPLRALVSYA